MTTLSPSAVNITPPRVPLVDERTGLISREWYRFFLSLFTLTGSGQNTASITDLMVGVPLVDQSGELSDVYSQGQIATLVSHYDALAAQMEQKVDILPRQELGTFAALQQNNLPWVGFDLSPEHIPPSTAGVLFWDEADGNKTLSLRMEGGEVTQQVGLEQFFRVKADVAITDGQVVMFTGTVGASGALRGAPATGLTAETAVYTMGVATEDIPLNGWGYVTSFGVVRGINTTGGGEGWVDGQILYLNPAVPGGMTKIVPVAPNPKVIITAIINAASNGSVFVRPTFGGRLGDFEGDVNITTPANGHLLIYDATMARWENATLTAGANVAITNGAGSISIASSNPGGSVTSVNVSGTGTGMTFSGGPITTSGTITMAGTLDANNGGTGHNVYAVGDLVYADTTSTLARRAAVATGNALISGGVGVAPTWGKIGLTTHVSGTLPTGNGGTGATSYTANGVVYASTATTFAAGAVLTFDGTNLRVSSTGNIAGVAGTTTMTAGFLRIPAAAGAPTGVPTALAGTVAMYYDTTSNRFYVYNGAWRSVVLA